MKEIKSEDLQSNFIRKNIKLFIIIIITVIIASGISAYATSSFLYNANDIKYKEEKSVENALDELYDNKRITSDNTYSIDSNGTKTLDKYYKNINVNVQYEKPTLVWTQLFT